ncbi:hypothetical protein AMR42_12560 [Limnothrix sp. PR1529]|nr:hypothetical protein BCR12_14740 [Limnothrix sp. P13C2]PIB09767.1 hypothetical protein AMR42_12560 [Limnothrix sp. PR1529]
MAGKPKYGKRKREIRLLLTEEAIDTLRNTAQAMGLRSASEVVEQFARGLLPNSPPDPDQLRMGKPLAI